MFMDLSNTNLVFQVIINIVTITNKYHQFN